MNRDLSHSDFAGLELEAQHRTAFRSLVEMGAPEHDAFINSLIGDNRVSRFEQEEEGSVLGAARWLVVAGLLCSLAIGTGLYLGSVVVM